MKKNLISILILGLLVVNVILTAIMMFSVTSTAKKTGALVTNIATVLNIEVGDKEEEKETTVQLTDTLPMDIEKLTIPLKRSTITNADGTVTTDQTTHYCLVEVTLLMNSKHEDYEQYATSMDSYSGMLKDLINGVIGSHTLEELQNSSEAVKDEILKKIQSEYKLMFIYRVTFRSIMYQ